MAIISTITRRVQNTIGDRKVTYGTYQGDTTGEIDTGLEVCEFLDLQGTASVAGTAAIVNVDNFPLRGTAVPIITTDASGGIWFAYGR